MTVALKDIATKGSDSLQPAIDILSRQLGQPGADTDAINAKIAALEDKQTQLQAIQTISIEESDANQAAIAALNAASRTLTTTASEIKDDAAALTKAATIVSDAAALVTALAPLM